MIFILSKSIFRSDFHYLNAYIADLFEQCAYPAPRNLDSSQRSGSITLEAWVYPTKNSGMQDVVSKSKDFTIQHGTGNEWDSLGTVAAAGNSNTIREYSYLDNSPVAGINYYRLLETDEDGRETYSDVKTVQFNTDVVPLIVYNNPVIDGTLQVELTTLCNLSLYDTQGRLVWQKQACTGAQLINVSGFAKGIYFLKVNNQSHELLVL